MTLSNETRNREIRLIARPRPAVTEALFQLVEGPVPQPGPGELLIRVLYLSLEPAMRGWISDAPNYREPLPLDETMFGFTVGQVSASNHPDYAAGDLVAGRQGWREWAVSDGSDIDRKLTPAGFPVTCHLHLLGLTGVTAYLGLLEVGQPKAGETVAVSTAAGAVGSTVGQIAKIKGCKTLGITGSDDKVAACKTRFGYDAALNYKTEADLSAAIGAACPEGIDVYFDNVGGPVSDAVMAHINVGARIVVCGTMGIAGSDPDSPPQGPRYQRQILVKRARMEGFLVLDHMDRREQALQDLETWLGAGQLNYLEDITEGLDQAPAALMKLLAGGNQGKAIVQLGPAP